MRETPKTPIVLHYTYLDVSIPVKHANAFVQEFKGKFHIEEKQNPDEDDPETRHFEIPVVPVDEEERFLFLLNGFYQKRGLIFEA